MASENLFWADWIWPMYMGYNIGLNMSYNMSYMGYNNSYNIGYNMGYMGLNMSYNIGYNMGYNMGFNIG